MPRSEMTCSVAAAISATRAAGSRRRRAGRSLDILLRFLVVPADTLPYICTRTSDATPAGLGWRLCGKFLYRRTCTYVLYCGKLLASIATREEKIMQMRRVSPLIIVPDA